MTSKIFAAINHVQSSASSAWTISHNFLSTPQCDVLIDINGVWTKVLPSAMYPLSSSQYRVEFNTATAGKARLVGEIQYVKPAELTGIGAGLGSIDPVFQDARTPYRYYQFYITANQDGGNWTNIYEVELRKNLGGPDITNPAMDVVASSTYTTEGGAPNKIINNGGNVSASSQGWDSGPATFPVTITIDLGAGNAQPVAQYTITNRQLNIYGPDRSPASWLFRGSDDGVNWTDLDSRTGIIDWTSGETKTFSNFSVPSAAVAAFSFFDSFTDTNGTFIDEHTADVVGDFSPWTINGAQNSVILNNELVVDGLLQDGASVFTPLGVDVVGSSGGFEIIYKMRRQRNEFISPFTITEPNYASVTLLLHGDGANTGTTITDSSPGGLTPDEVYGVQTLTANRVFGTSALDFNGGIRYAPSGFFAFGTGDFTIEAWIYAGGSGNQTLFSALTDSTTAVKPHIYAAGTSINYYVNGSNVISGANALATGEWRFFQLIRSGGVTSMYSNGVQVGSSYNDSNDYGTSTSAFAIGDYGTTLTGSSYFQGAMDDIRVTKGVARQPQLPVSLGVDNMAATVSAFIGSTQFDCVAVGANDEATVGAQTITGGKVALVYGDANNPYSGKLETIALDHEDVELKFQISATSQKIYVDGTLQASASASIPGLAGSTLPAFDSGAPGAYISLGVSGLIPVGASQITFSDLAANTL